MKETFHIGLHSSREMHTQFKVPTANTYRFQVDFKAAFYFSRLFSCSLARTARRNLTTAVYGLLRSVSKVISIWSAKNWVSNLASPPSGTTISSCDGQDTILMTHRL